MVTTPHFGLTLFVASLAIAVFATTGQAQYAATGSVASSAPAVSNTAIQYVYFDPATPALPSASGWLGNGRYNLPPDIGAVTMDAMAFGSIAASGGAPVQTFVVRLTLANSGTQTLTIDPGSIRVVDKTGHVLVGARAFSGETRVMTETLNAGGRDVLQLEFPLPPISDLRNLGTQDVELAYLYGSTPYIAHLPFALSEGPATYSAPATASYEPNPEAPNYTTNNYYYDTQPYADYGYAAYDYWPLWSTWGWSSGWWPGLIGIGSVGFVGDGDFDRDDGFFGFHHHDFDHGRFDRFANSVTTDSRFRNSTLGTGTKDLRGGRLEGNALIGKGAISTPKITGGKFEGTSHTTQGVLGTRIQGPSSNLTRGFTGSTGINRSETIRMAAPRGGTTFSTPRSNTNFSTSRGVTTFSAPRGGTTFSAPHFSTPSFSAPHYSTPSFSAPRSFSAPSFSGRSFGGGGGGAAHFSGGGGGGFHGGGGGRR